MQSLPPAHPRQAVPGPGRACRRAKRRHLDDARRLHRGGALLRGNGARGGVGRHRGEGGAAGVAPADEAAELGSRHIDDVSMPTGQRVLAYGGGGGGSSGYRFVSAQGHLVYKASMHLHRARLPGHRGVATRDQIGRQLATHPAQRLPEFPPSTSSNPVLPHSHLSTPEVKMGSFLAKFSTPPHAPLDTIIDILYDRDNSRTLMRGSNGKRFHI